MELVAGSGRISKARPIEFPDPIEMRKRHLDLVPLPLGGMAFVAVHDAAGSFEDRAWHLADWLARLNALLVSKH